jgi:Protein of unknown function (DUF3618)
MGKEPEDIRNEIEETRARMGDTVEALGYKTDVKSRTKDSISGAKENVMGKVSVAQENPLGLAFGSLALGFLAGMAVPSTKMEDERLGPIADQVRDKVKETSQEAIDRGKQVAQEVGQTAAESAQQAAQQVADKAKQTGQEQGQELASSAQQKAQEVSSNQS